MKKKYLFLTLFILFLISCESTSSNELQNSTFEELETARNIDVTTTSNQNLTTSTTTTTSTTSTTTTTLPVSKSINNIIKSFSLEEAEPWCSGPVSFIDFQNGYYFFVKHDWNSSFNCDYSDFDNDSQNSVVVLIEGESNITELSPNIVMECSLDEKGNFITSSVSLDYFPESSNLPGKSIYSSFNSYVFDNVSYGNGVVLSSFDNYLPRYHSVEYELNASGGSDGEFWYEPDKMTFPINGNFKYYFFHSENLKIKIPLDPRLIGIYEKSEAIFDFNLGNIYDSFKSIREVNGLNQNYQSLFSNKNFISSCFDQYSYTAPVKDYENKNIDNSLKADAKKYFQLTRRLLLGTQLLERLEKQITYMLYQLFDAETYSRNPELDLFVYFDDEVELSIRDSKTFLSGNNQYNWKSNEFFKFIKTDQVQRADIIIYGNYENYLKNLQENYENNIEECILNQTCSSVFTTNNYDNSNDNYSPSDYSSFYRAHMYLFSMDSFEGFIKYYLVGDQHPNISLDELKSIYSRIPFKLDSYDRAGWASLDIETFISWFIGFD
jgi:hypothetical protein